MLTDLWGNPHQEQGTRGKLADRFIVPPFSVLNAREGFWQDRKAAWIGLGIKSELGRGGNSSGNTYNDREWIKENGLSGLAQDAHIRESGSGSAINGTSANDRKTPPGLTWVGGDRDWDNLDETSRKILAASESGTSIFDPVLCELAYRWFVPAGGTILDPFAGGSVRGIVAAKLGYQYTGIDLRQEQVDANYEQWRAMNVPPETIKVSAAMMRQMFRPCSPEFIQSVCHARCCESSTSPSGIMVSIHATERAAIERLGGTVDPAGFLAATKRRCPFKTDADLCSLHGSHDKPFGCIASPFTLNNADTLIVRNRYRLLKCYGADGALPAYRAHRTSLERIFGADSAANVIDHLDGGGGDIDVPIPPESYRILRDNDNAKHSRTTGPQWICGDSCDMPVPDELRADFVFSCPPYGDLEVYSDDPRDLSTQEPHTFVANYRRIILKSCLRLKQDRFACFVVGDFRDTAGNYRNFPALTIAAFEAAGLKLYNEAILVTAAGSLPIRVGKQFAASRKLGKTHQNVLVFVKGSGERAAALIEQKLSREAACG